MSQGICCPAAAPLLVLQSELLEGARAGQLLLGPSLPRMTLSEERPAGDLEIIRIADRGQDERELAKLEAVAGNHLTGFSEGFMAFPGDLDDRRGEERIMQRLGEVDGLREDIEEVLRRRHPGRLRWVQKDEILREDHSVLRPLNSINDSDLGNRTAAVPGWIAKSATAAQIKADRLPAMKRKAVDLRSGQLRDHGFARVERQLHAMLESQTDEPINPRGGGVRLRDQRNRNVVGADVGIPDAVDGADEAHHEPVGGMLVELAPACPTCSIRPWFMTTMREATSIASSWSWVTSTVVTWTSSCSRRNQSRSSSRTRASRAPNGSSSSSTRGSTASARASAIRCRCPPESWAG